MAQQTLTGYQIVLIVILILNLIFWIFVIVWRIFILRENRITSRRYQRALRELLNFNPDRTQDYRMSSRISNNQILSFQRPSDVSTSPNINLTRCDQPPTYEEAVKFPSTSSLSTTTTNCISNELITATSQSRGDLSSRINPSFAPSTSHILLAIALQAQYAQTQTRLGRSASTGDLRQLNKSGGPFQV